MIFGKKCSSPLAALGELQTAVTDAQSLIADTLSRQSTAAVETLRERITDVKDQAEDIYKVSRKKVLYSARRVDDTVRDNPYQSLAAVAAAGFLVGLVVGRRGR